MKEAKRFTREEPVTKVELHNAFFNGQTYTRVAVVEFKRQCGDNAIKYLTKNDYAVMLSEGSVDYYELTDEGEEWLTKGLARYLELHPERVADVRRPSMAGPVKAPPRGRIIRRRA